MTTKEILLETKTLLSKPGAWTQGTYRRINENQENSYCIVGALSCLQLSYGEYCAARDKLNKAAQKIGYAGAINFNDCPGTTQAMVLDLFTMAILDSE